MKKTIKKIIEKILLLFPISDIIIFESSPDISDSSEAFYNFLIEKKIYLKYKIVWLLNNEDYKIDIDYNTEYIYRYTKKIINKIKLTYYENTARFIFDSNDYVYKKRKEQVRFYLGHGMPIKAPKTYYERAGEFDKILVTSNAFNKVFCELFNIKEDKVLSVGLPRNDYLLNNDEKLKQKIFYDKKVIFWMPTYRQHKNNKDLNHGSNHFGLPTLSNQNQILELNQLLEEKNEILLLRLHPAEDLTDINIPTAKNIIIANDNYLSIKNIKLYQLISMCDALITDYSSVYYDFLITKKPIGLTVSDLKEYTKKFGLIFDYEENIFGEYIHNFEQLKQFFLCVSKKETIDIKKYDVALKQYHEFPNNSSCERLYDYLKNNNNF